MIRQIPKHYLALIAALIGISVVFAAWSALKRPDDVRNESAGFVAERPVQQKKPRKAATVAWPMYGLDRARTRNLQVKIRGPFDRVWRYGDKTLLEFPPIYARGRLWLINNDARVFSFDAPTGKILWSRRVGRLNASSPAYKKGFIYLVNLEPGQVMKLNAKTGRTVWRKSLPGRSESSPVIRGNTLYFGCENGQLFALDTRNGKTKWATYLGGAVKAAPALYRGILYVGDYGGNMNAVNAKTGKLKWQSGSQGSGFGTGGTFYSTPAVAFGRVYSGNNDGRIYSYDIKDGTLAWSYSTGGYAYSGPAVTSTKRTPPTVYIGSFDGNIYALNAKTGETRWSNPVGGQVIGSLTVLGETVYIAEFTNTTTLGYDTLTGKQVFQYPTGTYTPVISDGRWIYLTGYSSLHALKPVKRKSGKKGEGKGGTEKGAKAKRQGANSG